MQGEPTLLNFVQHNSRPKRIRATNADIALWDDFLMEYADLHKPVTVRQLFYAATVYFDNVPKTEEGYGKIQRRVRTLRMQQIMPMYWLADYSRSVWGVESHTSPSNALQDFSNNYHYDFWADHDETVEVWLEKSALAGVLEPVTHQYQVNLCPSAGQSSITFLEAAIRRAAHNGKHRFVAYTLYDFDASGRSAAQTVSKRLQEFGEWHGVEVIHRPLALNYEQVVSMKLPSRPPKQEKQAWEYPIAAELDAIPPAQLRQMVKEVLETHMPAATLARNMAIQDFHRQQIRMAIMQ